MSRLAAMRPLNFHIPSRPVVSSLPLSEHSEQGREYHLGDELQRSSSEHSSGTVTLTKLRKLGSGSYAEVYLVHYAEKHRDFALKKFLHADSFHQHIKESRVIERRKVHPNLVKYYKVTRFENCPALLMEYVDGTTLCDLSTAAMHQIEREALAKAVLFQLVLALDYLHDCHIYHRDLKSDNVLVHRNGRVKLSDFNTAKFCSTDTYLSNTQDGASVVNTFCGAVAMLPPEAWRPTTPACPAKGDLWSLGLTILGVVTGRSVPTTLCRNHLEVMELSQNLPLEECLRGVGNDALCDVIKRLLQVDPALRSTTKEVLSHEIFRAELSATRSVSRALEVIHARHPDIKDVLHSVMAYRLLTRNDGDKEENEAAAVVLDRACRWSVDIVAKANERMRKGIAE